MIRKIVPAAALCVLTACAGTRVPQTDSPPPRPERYTPSSATERAPTDEEATERFLDQEIEKRTPPPPAPRTSADSYRRQLDRMNRREPTNEEATELFLDHEIERRRYVAPAPVPQHVVERIYVEVPSDPYREHYRREHDYYRSRFPWNTAVGAGLGAVIGHQSGRRDRGAAIGAGVGLLFDLARWH